MISFRLVNEEANITKMEPNGHFPNTVFITLPSKETLSLRGLANTLPVGFLQARVELETGLPSHTYLLQYGQLTWKNSDILLNFSHNIRSGAVIKLIILGPWKNVYNAAKRGSFKKVQDALRHLLEERNSEEEDNDHPARCDLEMGNPEETYNQRLFVALSVACCYGATKLVNTIINQDESHELVHWKTPFERSLFHLAAAMDKLATLELLGAEVHPKNLTDVFGHTPMDLAKEFGAMAAERVLKNLCRSRKRIQARRKLTAKLDQRKPQYVRTTRTNCWDDDEEDANNPLSHTLKISFLRRGEEYSPCRGSSTGGRWQSSRTSSARRSTVSSPQHHTHNLIVSNKSTTKSVGEKQQMAVTKPAKNEPVALFKQRKTPVGNECPSVPCSSLNGSLEDLGNIVLNEDTLKEDAETEQERMGDAKQAYLESRRKLAKAYTKPQQTTYRAQSAKYYKTQFHTEEDDPTIPKPRPKTAGSRYRQWKTWLLQKMEDDAMKAKQLEQRSEIMEENAEAFKQWLRAKQRKEEESSDEDSSDDDPYAYAYAPKETGITFEKWLELRKESLHNLDSQTRLAKSGKQGKEQQRKAYDDRRVTIYELRDTDLSLVPKDNPNHHMRAYQKWVDKRKKYELWKKRTNVTGDSQKRDDITRDALVLDGMTYEEWLGQKYC